MNTNTMELNLDKMAMVNGGDTGKQVAISGGSVSICAIYGAGAGLLTAGPVGAAIGGAAGAAVGGIIYGVYRLVSDD